MKESDLIAQGFVKTPSGWVKKPQPGGSSTPAKKAARKIQGKASRIQGTQGAMNKTETRYSQHLEALKAAGEVARWDFEPEKLRLAKATFYTPDFRVILPTGEVQFHEVKGHWEDDARVKIKVAAAMHPYTFLAVQWKSKSWKVETF